MNEIYIQRLNSARLWHDIAISGNPLFTDSIDQWIGLNYYARHPQEQRGSVAVEQ